MLKDVDPPRIGEEWAGWAPSRDGVRKLAIIEVIGPTSYLVEYSVRGHGRQQEVAEAFYLIQPWEPYRKQQQERRDHNRRCAELQEALHQAMASSGMTCSKPWVYSASPNVHLNMDKNSADILLSALKALGQESRSDSALENLF